MVARDIMKRKVFTVGPRMSLRELAGFFESTGVSGAPVVESNGCLVGVVSRGDLLNGLGRHERVEEIMTPWAVSVEEDTPVEELARQMLGKRIHRIPITRDGQLCGLVTTYDMLRALLALSKAASR